MSSPIAIPHSSIGTSTYLGVDSFHPTSSSPSGLYIPIHKRTGSAASTTSSSSRSSSPSRSIAQSWKSRSPSKHGHRSAKSTSASTSQGSSFTHDAFIPKQTKIPNTYTITDLLIMSSSPLARLSHEQMEGVRRVMPVFSVANSSSSSQQKAAPRRRRTSRRDAKKPQPQRAAANTNAEVDIRRRHHGTFGWHPVAHTAVVDGAVDSWRHETLVAVHA